MNGGSGVIFQPADPNHSYILTCNHVFDDIENAEYQNLVHIYKYDEASIRFVKVDPFPLLKGINYFPHAHKDIAILKIPRQPGADNLLRLDDFDKYTKRVSLYGFPEMRREEVEFIDRIREDSELIISTLKSNGRREAKIPDNANYDELVGQSGGGLFCIEGNYVGLLGIQNKVPNRNESMGRIEFTPMIAFDEIVAASDQALEFIRPFYLNNFEFLISDIFKIPVGLQSKQAGESITKILRAKAQFVVNSDLTPIVIRDYLKEKLLLIDGQPKEDLYKRKIWSLWLELLTILNVAKEKTHSQADCEEMFKKVRLFYADVNEDFWLSHLSELVKCDYSGLEENGLVVVASNVSATDFHVLETEHIVQDIGQLKREHALHKMERNIDTANDFPFEQFKFVNISAFKEETVQKKYREFAGMDISQTLARLKILYEKFFS
jgi:hypothetical protein